MKENFTCLIIFLSIFHGGCNTASEDIDYGSNNGKYLSINNLKIYFEEYGHGTPNSQYCVLPNTTHDVFAGRPELITRIALDFLN